MGQDVRKILLIEDEAEMISLVRLIFGRRGFEVTGTADSEQGLILARTEKPDVILLDLMMPDFGGWQIYQALKADPATQSSPVILMTAKAVNVDKVIGMHIRKADDYIARPFSLQELVDRVEAVIARNQSPSNDE